MGRRDSCKLFFDLSVCVRRRQGSCLVHMLGVGRAGVSSCVLPVFRLSFISTDCRGGKRAKRKLHQVEKSEPVNFQKCHIHTSPEPLGLFGSVMSLSSGHKEQKGLSSHCPTVVRSISRRLPVSLK